MIKRYSKFGSSGENLCLFKIYDDNTTTIEDNLFRIRSNLSPFLTR